MSSSPPTTTEHVLVSSLPHVRKSTRATKPPIWHTDYITKSSTSHPISSCLSYYAISSSYKAYLTTFSASITEPSSYNQVSQNKQWVYAMDQEIVGLTDNHTSEVVDLPAGKTFIVCKRVYKVKYKDDGSIERYKARLVAKGFTQQDGLDYHDTFSPVVKMVTVRAVVSIAAQSNWPLFQMDVYNAFIQGDIFEDVYMTLPPGFGSQGEHKVCRLLKSMYGLKQASR